MNWMLVVLFIEVERILSYDAGICLSPEQSEVSQLLHKSIFVSVPASSQAFSRSCHLKSFPALGLVVSDLGGSWKRLEVQHLWYISRPTI